MPDPARPAGDEDIPRELAGWYLLESDLRHVVSAARALQSLQRQPVGDPTVGRSLWTSAHIAYARCFVVGPTVKLDAAMFDGQPDGHAQAHRFLLFTANKHLSQPLNPFLQVRVNVERDADDALVGIKYTPTSSSPSQQDVANLSWLAAAALKHVEAIETGLVARLKERLQAGPPASKPPA